MKARLRQAWESRSPRDRAVLAALALLLTVGGYVALVMSAQHARGSLRPSVTALRGEAARLDQHAQEYAHLVAAPKATASTTALRTLVQSRVAEAGLASALLRLEAADANQVVVVFGAVAFADWLNLVAGLASEQARLESCRIEALPASPGLVSVTATLVRPAAP